MSTDQHKFRIGDPVWAKMKGFSPWPGVVVVPPVEVKRPAIKKTMHCVCFFGTKDYAWIEETSMKPYEEFKETLTKDKKSKAMQQAIEEIEKYLHDKDPSIVQQTETQTKNQSEDAEFDALISGKQSAKKSAKKEGRKRNISEESGSTASGPSSSTSKKARGRPPTKAKEAKIEEERDASPVQYSKKAAVSNLLDRPSVLRPASPALGMDLVTSSQTLREKDIQPSKLNFGFLGLGIMGSGMVKNLLNSGHLVTVWNRSTDKVKDFVEAGAKEALTPSDVIAECDITFSCVSDPQAAKDLVFGNCGVLQEINTTKGYVEMTSVDSDTSQDIAEAISLKGGRYLEAQIQGSKTQAQDGTLVVLVAGDRSLFDDCQSCFQAMGKNSFYLGEVGNASKMNLVLQTMIGVTLAGLAEGMALADRAGLQQKDVLEVLELTGLNCPSILQKGKAIIDGGFPTHQPLQHMQLLPMSKLSTKVCLEKLSLDCSKLLEDGQFSDITIVCQEEENEVKIPAHKCILGSRSPVFNAMFNHNMTEAQTKEVKIIDLNLSTVKDMLRYMYIGKIEDLNTRCPNLLEAADKYQLSELKEICEDTLCSNLTVENSLECLVLADLHNAQELKTASVKFIVEHSADFVDQIDKFKEYPDLMAELLKVSWSIQRAM